MINKIVHNDKLLFILISVIFGLVLFNANIFGDDLYFMHIANGTINDYFARSIEMYSNWSSRVLINFLIFFFNDNNIIYWVIFMVISMYALLYSFSKLFTDNDKSAYLFVASLILLFPYEYLASAGWISTTITYFSPIAFGFLSLVPIKKAFTNENYRGYEYILYPLSLIFGANNEQIMFVILGCYVVAFIYLLINKKVNTVIIINLILAIISALYIGLCPGNTIRKAQEISGYFPTFESLNILSKFDLCFSHTMNWLFFDNSFITICLLILCILTFIKYKDICIRIISLIPVVFTVIINFIKGGFAYLFPYLSNLTNNISIHGLVTSTNRGSLNIFITYMVWVLLLLCILITVIKLSNDFKTLLSSLTFLVFGFGSRMALMFSPTIYRSGNRTSSMFIFTIFAIIVSLYSNNLDNIKNSKFKNFLTYYLPILLIILNLINIIYIFSTISS